jgi:hypothetical protein
VAQGVGPEFKHQHHKKPKTKKQNQKQTKRSSTITSLFARDSQT